MSAKDSIKTGLLGLGAMRYRNQNSKLLYYHDVYDVFRYTDMGTPMGLFERHLEVIGREGFLVVPRIKNDEGEVALLFDDGFHGIYDVRQFFYDRYICPTVFLAVSMIGKEGYLNKEEILELQQHGLNFESHGWSHKDLTSFDDQGLHHELVDARQWLSDFLQKDVRELCLPLGYFSERVVAYARGAGYTTIYSSVPGSYHQLIHGSLRARNLLQFASPRQVRYILRGGNEVFRPRLEKMHFKRK